MKRKLPAEQPTLPLDDTPNPPPYAPLHPAFVGVSRVLHVGAVDARNLDGPGFTVNLNLGTCTCNHGEPYQWDATTQPGKWIANKHCIHKIRAVADLIRRHPDEHTKGHDRHLMMAGYIKMVGGRYNKYEAVSAFHKELRRGDVPAAYYWGCVLSHYRGIKGVIKYLFNIVFEEGRDFTLAEWLMGRLNAADFTPTTCHNAIRLFCLSKKKWELPHRMPILEAEMRAYGRLVARYGQAVAKASHIIDAAEQPTLVKVLLQSLAKKDLVGFQFGLKGLQKMNDERGPKKLDLWRADIANILLTEAERLRLPVLQAPYFEQYNAFLATRASTGHGIGYHELNALADMLIGEPYGAGNTSADMLQWANTSRTLPDIQLGILKHIPLYAQDNHTYVGKTFIRSYPHELKAGAEQKNMDLRGCGAYMGVTWRHLAVAQHGSTDCAWGEVDWPKWLYDTVINLFY
jgi:hypothetical protein